MTIYTPIFCCAELKLAFRGKITWKVADTLQYYTKWSEEVVSQPGPVSWLPVSQSIDR